VTEQDVQKNFLYEDYSTPIRSKITNRLFFRSRKKKDDGDTKSDKVFSSKQYLPSILTRLCPVVGFIKHYTREALFNDISAGFAVGLAAIPMGREILVFLMLLHNMSDCIFSVIVL
jgi:hypothetical protein